MCIQTIRGLASLRDEPQEWFITPHILVSVLIRVLTYT
jgi:hypothetical protein